MFRVLLILLLFLTSCSDVAPVVSALKTLPMDTKILFAEYNLGRNFINYLGPFRLSPLNSESFLAYRWQVVSAMQSCHSVNYADLPETPSGEPFAFSFPGEGAYVVCVIGQNKYTRTWQTAAQASSSGIFEVNTTPPNLSITTEQPLISGLNSASITGACEIGFDIEIYLADVLESKTSCLAGTYSYELKTQTIDGSRLYQIKQTNSVQLSKSVSFQWIRDTKGPQLLAGHFKVNDNSDATGNSRVQVALSGTDSLTRIVDLCLKVDVNATPESLDPCWMALDSPGIGVTPAQNINISEVGFNLPITPGAYKVIGWLRDEAGNVSEITNSGSGTAFKDFDDITLSQTVPPKVYYVHAGSTDFPSLPPSKTDLTVGLAAPVYVKWRATDDKVLPPQPISIYFSNDEVNWTLVANNLLNGGNGGCEVNHPSTPADDNATGCYKVNTNPTAGYVKYRVVVKDSDGLESGLNSYALNISDKMRFLAGNTEPGLNLSAKSAIFFYRRMSSDSMSVDTHSLAVTRDGVVFFKDALRGILKIDPADGVVRSFLKQTGEISGDGGVVSSATARYIHKITLDHNYPKQRLWLFDYDRIRRVDLETGTITTVIGGGTDESDTVVNPLNAKLRDVNWNDSEFWDSYLMFFAAPNGDFYFRAGNDGWGTPESTIGNNKVRVRMLSAATGQISSWRIPSVTSGRDLAEGDYSKCSFRGLGFSYNKSNSQIMDRIGVLRLSTSFIGCPGNAAHFVGLNSVGQADMSLHPKAMRSSSNTNNERFKPVTGLDGKIYAVFKDNYQNGIWRYDGAPSYSWTRILGGGASDFQMGSCEDGTSALLCRSLVADVFVTENGTVYFVDDGLVRAINPAGNVITLMGQRPVSGVGELSLMARLGNSIRNFRLRDDGGIVFADQGHQKIYEFDPNGKLYHIAGNGGLGLAADNVDARNTLLNIENPNNSGDEFGLDSVTGDIYHHAGYAGVKKMSRGSNAIGATGTWSVFLGGGTDHWASSAANGSSSLSWSTNCEVNVDINLFKDPSCWMYPRVLALAGGQLLLHSSTQAQSISSGAYLPHNNMMKLYSLTTKAQTHLIGKGGYNVVTGNPSDGLSPIGTPLDSTEFWAANNSRVSNPYYLGENRWLFMRYANNSLKNVYDVTVGGVLNSFTTLNTGAKSFTYRVKLEVSYIYYCGTDGKLYRRNMATSTEDSLPLPIAGMSCESAALFFRESSQSLIFAYKLNGLMGFGEYFDPM